MSVMANISSFTFLSLVRILPRTPLSCGLMVRVIFRLLFNWLTKPQVDLDAALPSVCSWNLGLAQLKMTPRE